MKISKYLNYYIEIKRVDEKLLINLVEAEKINPMGKKLMVECKDGKLLLYISQSISNLPKTAHDIEVMDTQAVKVKDEKNFPGWYTHLSYKITKFKVSFLGLFVDSETDYKTKGINVPNTATDITISNKPKSPFQIPEAYKYM